MSSLGVLGACAALECLVIGMQVHGIAIKYGIRLDQFVVTWLVNFYARCGALDLARKTFREVHMRRLPSWTALIGGCAQRGKGREAIDLFYKLYSSSGKASEKTLATVLGAFSDTNEIKVGKQHHSLILKLGFDSFTFVGNAQLDFYSRSGLLEGTLKIFEEMDVHDVVTWNALIVAHMNSGYYEEDVKLLRAMLSEGFELSLYTYSSILSIGGDLPAVQWGEQTHCCVMKANFGSSVVVGSALTDYIYTLLVVTDVAKLATFEEDRNLHVSICNKDHYYH